MKMLLASAFAIALFAGSTSANAGAMYYVTVDTVGNCSVAEGPPSAGQKALGNADGYKTQDEAGAELEKIRGDESVCKGVVE
ncbi:MAG: hypothetical protein QNJ62_11145 [Methyloceanibacter sp.]|nr:hypothetical protein [Methyloceanibacter sp.]